MSRCCMLYMYGVDGDEDTHDIIPSVLTSFSMMAGMTPTNVCTAPSAIWPANMLLIRGIISAGAPPLESCANRLRTADEESTGICMPEAIGWNMAYALENFTTERATCRQCCVHSSVSSSWKPSQIYATPYSYIYAKHILNIVNMTTTINHLHPFSHRQSVIRPSLHWAVHHAIYHTVHIVTYSQSDKTTEIPLPMTRRIWCVSPTNLWPHQLLMTPSISFTNTWSLSRYRWSWCSRSHWSVWS